MCMATIELKGQLSGAAEVTYQWGINPAKTATVSAATGRANVMFAVTDASVKSCSINVVSVGESC